MPGDGRSFATGGGPRRRRRRLGLRRPLSALAHPSAAPAGVRPVVAMAQKTEKKGKEQEVFLGVKGNAQARLGRSVWHQGKQDAGEGAGCCRKHSYVLVMLGCSLNSTSLIQCQPTTVNVHCEPRTVQAEACRLPGLSAADRLPLPPTCCACCSCWA